MACMKEDSIVNSVIIERRMTLFRDSGIHRNIGIGLRTLYHLRAIKTYLLELIMVSLSYLFV